MDQPRLDEAMSRIEAALARIEAASVRSAGSGESAWAGEHQSLKARVGDSLAQLEALIAELEQ